MEIWARQEINRAQGSEQTVLLVGRPWVSSHSLNGEDRGGWVLERIMMT